MSLSCALNKDIGTIHFIGIGGIGMSGVADILVELGYCVTGSDMGLNSVTQNLEKKGVKIFEGHNKDNVKNADVVVLSTAVKENNIEYIEAAKKGLKIFKRQEILSYILQNNISYTVAGTHGKTTTTSLLGHMFEKMGKNPTIINGGIINSIGSNVKIGTNTVVAEADESDATFVNIPSNFGMVTNIDAEHLDFYGSFENLLAAFKKYINDVPIGNYVAVCFDDENIKTIVQQLDDKNKIICYGVEESNEYRAININFDINGICFDIVHNNNVYEKFTANLYGMHNVKNVLGVISLGHKIGYDLNDLKNIFADFSGVQRRFTIRGKYLGVDVVDDYAHHPVEIATVINAAKQFVKGDIYVIMQPHRYTRLRDLYEQFCKCFVGAKNLMVLPVYTAGEYEIENINSVQFAKDIFGVNDVSNVYNLEDIKEGLKNKINKDDIVLFFGAGDITNLSKLICDND